MLSDIASITYQPVLKLASGNALTLYQPVGAAICHTLNQDKSQGAEHATDNQASRCQTVKSAGSKENLTRLLNNTVDLGLVRADMLELLAATNNESELTVLSTLYAESIVIVLRSDLDSPTLDDLQGRPVLLGAQNSGDAEVAVSVLREAGWSTKDIGSRTYESSFSLQQDICSGSVDAAFIISGHPAALLKYLTSSCTLKILSLEETLVSSWLTKNSPYRAEMLNIDRYTGNSGSILTMSVPVKLVASGAQTSIHEKGVVTKLLKSNRSLQKILSVIESQSVDAGFLVQDQTEGSVSEELLAIDQIDSE